MKIVERRIQVLLEVRHKIAPNADPDFEVVNLTEMVQKISMIGLILAILLASVASISLFVGSIGIMNMMLTSVTERTKEIGIRKAIGAPNKSILYQFLIESVLISFIGSFLGMVLGITLALTAGSIFNKEVPISIFTIFISIFAAVFLAVNVSPYVFVPVIFTLPLNGAGSIEQLIVWVPVVLLLHLYPLDNVAVTFWLPESVLVVPAVHVNPSPAVFTSVCGLPLYVKLLQ